MYFVKVIGAVSIGVIDAGSTGTRLKIFEFDGKKLISQKFYKSEQIPGIDEKKGIHNLEDKDIERTLKHLFKTSEVSKKTPVGFYGTGGLRSVNQARQKAILDIVRESVQDYNLVQSKIISGNEEALYSYRAFEFLNPEEGDYSIIDMGGKSVQIVEKGSKEVRLFSLEMGVLNSKCKEKPEKQSVLNSIGLSGFDSKDKSLYFDTAGAESLFSFYTCGESQKKKKQRFKCSKNDFRDSKIRELRDRKENAKNKSFCLEKETEKGKYGVFKKIGLLNFFRNSSTKLHSQDENCIDDFFKTRGAIKLRLSSKTFLMSFFEEMIKSDKEMTLREVFDGFNKKCRENSEEDCQKYYYSIKFLNKIGLESSSKIRLANKKDGLDVSWTLGIALDLKDGIYE